MTTNLFDGTGGFAMAARPIGSKRKRGKDTWQLVANVVDGAGERHQKTKTFHGTEAAATKALAKWVASVQADVIDPTTATVAELLDTWMDQAEPEMAGSTAQEFRGVIKRSIKPRAGGTKVAELRPVHLTKLYADLRKSGGNCRRDPKFKCDRKTFPCPHGGGAPLSPGSVKKVHVVFHAALEWAVAEEWILRNPASKLAKTNKKIKVVKKKPVPATKSDVEVVLAWLRENDFELWAFTMLAAKRGPRPGEVCALQWCDIDLDNELITFDGNIGRKAGGGFEAKGTKTDKGRTIALVGQAHAAVKAHRARCVELALALGVALPRDAYLFQYDLTGERPWRPSSAGLRLRRHRLKHGLPYVTFRMLRHYVATTLITLGTDIRTVGGTLGHERPSTTLDVYADWVPEADREAAHRMDEDDDVAEDPDASTAVDTDGA